MTTGGTRRQSQSRLLFVGSYTGPASRGIHAFHFDEHTGRLLAVGLAAETANPSFLTASRDGRLLFAVNETGTYNGEPTGSVTSFAVDQVAARLTPISVASTRGGAPCHLALDATETVLAVANYANGSFVLLPIAEDGRLEPVQTVLASTGSGPDPARQAGPHAHMVLFDPTNRYLLGADLGTDRVLVYRFDPSGSRLAEPHGTFDVEPGSGPRHLAFHPFEPLLFAINELSSTISTFAWDELSGLLHWRGDDPTLPPGATAPSTTAEIAVHPNGRFLYASNRGHDSLACFALSADGQFALIGHTDTLGRTPRHFAIDPSGRWLIVANQNSDTLVVFAVDEVTGRLTSSGPPVECGSPACVLFMS